MKGKRASVVVTLVLAVLLGCLALPGTAFARPGHGVVVQQAGWGDVGIVCLLAALIIIPCAALLIADLARRRRQGDTRSKTQARRSGW